MMKQQDWQGAVSEFAKAAAVQANDAQKIRTYGVNFMEYFPHREMGICYFNLGDSPNAINELETSMKTASSTRAREYLDRARGGSGGAGQGVTTQPRVIPRETQAPPQEPSTKSLPVRIVEEKTKKVGQRLSVAVLPFESKGDAKTLGEIVLDKLTTSLVNLQRFNVMERSKLEELLKEQKLGMSGIIDASTAAQVGKNIGVEGIVLGSVSFSGNLVSIDARLIDTASGSILSARDVSSGNPGIDNVKRMVDDLVQKVANDIPILAGTVIQVEGDLLYIDIGLNRGIRKGMKFVIYREGEPIKHPVTGEILGTKIEELADVAITEPMERMSAAQIVRRIGGAIEVGSKAITK